MPSANANRIKQARSTNRQETAFGRRLDGEEVEVDLADLIEGLVMENEMLSQLCLSAVDQLDQFRWRITNLERRIGR